MMNNNLLNNDLRANNNGNSIHPSEVSQDSTMSDLILDDGKDGSYDGRNRRTSALSFFDQAIPKGRDHRALGLSLSGQVTGPTMVSVSTMTATNPADPYNPTFFMH